MWPHQSGFVFNWRLCNIAAMLHPRETSNSSPQNFKMKTSIIKNHSTWESLYAFFLGYIFSSPQSSSNCIFWALDQQNKEFKRRVNKEILNYCEDGTDILWKNFCLVIFSINRSKIAFITILSYGFVFIKLNTLIWRKDQPKSGHKQDFPLFQIRIFNMQKLILLLENNLQS